jgi:hypothetical protein
VTSSTSVTTSSSVTVTNTITTNRKDDGNDLAE